jgi:hypothetical protein
MNLDEFQQFFANCVGTWATERTYHYLGQQEVERSHTDFVVEPIGPETKLKVLSDNAYEPPANLEALPGFELKFQTVSEAGVQVNQDLRMFFVPHREVDGWLEGDYLRDRAYEEARPIISAFRFHRATAELQMTTRYTRTTSVDSILMVNPNLRIRRILNYARPAEGEPLRDVMLVGFGVEQKVGIGG